MNVWDEGPDSSENIRYDKKNASLVTGATFNKLVQKMTSERDHGESQQRGRRERVREGEREGERGKEKGKREEKNDYFLSVQTLNSSRHSCTLTSHSPPLRDCSRS